MSEQPQVQPPIAPHQAAIEKMLADATAAGNDFDRLTFLSRCNSALSRECEETAERLLKVHRGKLLSVEWNVDFEYDDEGGTFPSVSGITLHLEDGREILLGDTNYAFNDDGVIDDFIILSYPEAKELEQALEQERQFARQHLWLSPERVTVEFPWNRMFELNVMIAPE